MFAAFFGSLYINYLIFKWTKMDSISEKQASSLANETAGLHYTLDHLLGPWTKYFTALLSFYSFFYIDL